ncbi:hypothetical protein FGIG_10449, partial [Fasciola gigantica]
SLLVKCDKPSLCGSLSSTLREAGNTAWREGDAKRALVAYNKALMTAVDDEQKAFVYANRSLVLASLCMHSSALKDTERALQVIFSPCSIKFNYKELLARRSQYLSLAIDRVQEAYDEFLLAAKKMEGMGLQSDTLKKQIQEGLRKCEKILESKMTIKPPNSSMVPIKYLHISTAAETQVSLNDQREDKNAQSLSFEVNYGGNDVGWQLVASKAIRPGELITVEKPYARYLHLSCATSHCFQCFRRTVDPVPCRRCAYVS